MMTGEVGRVDADVVVVGGGVVGLGVGVKAVEAGKSVVVLEAEGRVGEHTSSRNSGVIHAGLYYPPGSAKAELCVEGKEMLYEYAEDRNVPFANVGKIVVGGSDRDPDEVGSALSDLLERGKANGVDDLELIDDAAVAELEPSVVSSGGGLLSPSTGIIDPGALMMAYTGHIEDAGSLVVPSSPVQAVVVREDGSFEVHAGGTVLRAGAVVTACGLWASAFAANAIFRSPSMDPESRLDAEGIPPTLPLKGQYFYLAPAAASALSLSRLVYPLPASKSLGIHITLDMDGGVRAGPDQVEDAPLYIPSVSPNADIRSQPDYRVREGDVDKFYAGLRTFLPSLPDGCLSAGYSGLRPQVVGKDFVFHDSSVHGVPGLVNLIGVESPGLTSSLAIGARVIDTIFMS